MIKQKIFCVISEHYPDRQNILEQIKEKAFKGGSTPLNTFVLYSRRLEAEDLADVLSRFSFDNKKLIVIKDADLLSPECRKVLLDDMKNAASINCFLFEIEKNPLSFMTEKKVVKDDFLQYVFTQGIVRKRDRREEKIDSFSLVSAVRRRNAASAFYLLEKLFLENKNDRTLGMQVLGALIYSFSSISDAGTRRKYLEAVWQADRLIKEQGIDPKVSLELLLAKILAT